MDKVYDILLVFPLYVHVVIHSFSRTVPFLHHPGMERIKDPLVFCPEVNGIPSILFPFRGKEHIVFCCPVFHVTHFGKIKPGDLFRFLLGIKSADRILVNLEQLVVGNQVIRP